MWMLFLLCLLWPLVVGAQEPTVDAATLVPRLAAGRATVQVQGRDTLVIEDKRFAPATGQALPSVTLTTTRGEMQHRIATLQAHRAARAAAHPAELAALDAKITAWQALLSRLP